MDLSIFFAGTAGSVPTARRGLPAILLRRGADRVLFDCGEGTQRQLLRSVGLIGPDRRLRHALPRRPLARPAGDAQDLRPARARAAADDLRPARPARADAARARTCSGRLSYDLDARSSSSPTSRSSATATRSRPFPVNHRGRRYGYAIVEDDRPGPLRRRAGASGSASRPAPTSAACSAARPSSGVRARAGDRARPPRAQARDLRRHRPLRAARSRSPHRADVLVHEATFTREEADARARDAALHRRAGRQGRAREAEVRDARAHAPLDALRRARDPRRGARGRSRARSSRATSTRSRCRSPSAASPSWCAGTARRRRKAPVTRGRGRQSSRTRAGRPAEVTRP